MACTNCSTLGKAAEAIAESRLLIDVGCRGEVYPLKNCDVSMTREIRQGAALELKCVAMMTIPFTMTPPCKSR